MIDERRDRRAKRSTSSTIDERRGAAIDERRGAAIDERRGAAIDERRDQ